MAISNNCATNNLAFGKHLKLTLDSSNISSRFIHIIYSERSKMGVPNNKDTHQAFSIWYFNYTLKLKTLSNLINHLSRDVALEVFAVP